MARRRVRVVLRLFINARPTGTLTREASGAVDFRYAVAWLEWEHAFPISLSLPLREERYVGAPVQAVFDNLLPDSDAIRRRIAQRVRAEGPDFFSLLAAIGRDCVGAMQLLPEGEDPGPAGVVVGDPVSPRKIAEILRNLGQAPLGLGEEAEFRISIAGAQEKTALLRWHSKWHIPTGSAATTHILKPQIGKLPSGIDLSQSVENEFLCLRIAKAFGLPVAEADMREFAGVRVLVVKRFDRLWTKNKRLLRLPQEDLCQALGVPPSRRYEFDGGPGVRQIVDLLRASDDPDIDQRIFLKALVVFWLLGATDGHAKNFSIHLLPGGHFRLAPLYDIMSVQPYLDARQLKRNRARLAMAVGDGRHRALHVIMPRHFEQTARSSHISVATMREVLSEVGDRANAVASEMEKSLPRGFPGKLADCILNGMRDRASLCQATKAA